jgi:hypothetical protein
VTYRNAGHQRIKAVLIKLALLIDQDKTIPFAELLSDDLLGTVSA